MQLAITVLISKIHVVADLNLTPPWPARSCRYQVVQRRDHLAIERWCVWSVELAENHWLSAQIRAVYSSIRRVAMYVTFYFENSLLLDSTGRAKHTTAAGRSRVKAWFERGWPAFGNTRSQLGILLGCLQEIHKLHHFSLQESNCVEK